MKYLFKFFFYQSSKDMIRIDPFSISSRHRKASAYFISEDTDYVKCTLCMDITYTAYATNHSGTQRIVKLSNDIGYTY